MSGLASSSAYGQSPREEESASLAIGASNDVAREQHGRTDNYPGVQIGPVSHGRKLAHRRVESGKPLAFSLSRGEWGDAAAAAFKEEVGDDAHSAKRLSRILECSWRTAENYLQGRTVPNAIHMLRAYAMIPAFAAEVRRLTGMQQTLDPEFERDLSAFMERAANYLERRGT